MSDETVQESGASNQKQEKDEKWDRYLEQQRRLSCPGCGEGDKVF